MKWLTSISIELTNNCNMDCPYCHRAMRPLGNMTWPLFKHVIDQVPRYFQVCLSFGGESIVHPQFKEYAEYAGAKHFRKLVVETNGLQSYPKTVTARYRPKPPTNLYSTYPFKLEHPTVRHRRCRELDHTLVILWNGDVTKCCWDVGGQLVYDNIVGKSIFKVWNSQHMNSLRKVGHCEGCEVY